MARDRSSPTVTIPDLTYHRASGIFSEPLVDQVGFAASVNL